MLQTEPQSTLEKNVFSAYIAFGSGKSINAVLCGFNFTNVPFLRFMFLMMTSVPSSRNKLFIIQRGMCTLPSSAENSSTPQKLFLPS